MRISMQVYKQLAVVPPPPQQLPMSSFGRNITPPSLNVGQLFNSRKKVVFVMGPTGAGKSRLSIDLASHFPAEIINSDKLQVYKGLDIVTNKVTAKQQRGVPHHLLSVADPDTNFTAESFRQAATEIAESIVMHRRRLPIVAGGSNSYIEALVDDGTGGLRSRNFDCCFLWVDVALPVLDMFLDKRVDEMVAEGMVDEARQFFNPSAGYDQGIRTAIGVREFDGYLRKGNALEEAVEEVKGNTRALARRQLKKIERLRDCKGWRIQRIDATEVFKMKLGGEDYEQAWKELVLKPAVETLSWFTTTSLIGGGPHGIGYRSNMIASRHALS